MDRAGKTRTTTKKGSKGRCFPASQVSAEKASARTWGTRRFVRIKGTQRVSWRLEHPTVLGMLAAGFVSQLEEALAGGGQRFGTFGEVEANQVAHRLMEEA